MVSSRATVFYRAVFELPNYGLMQIPLQWKFNIRSFGMGSCVCCYIRYFVISTDSKKQYKTK